MYKQAVHMVLLVGVLLSAAAIANGGSLNGIFNGVTTDGLYSSGLDRGLEVGVIPSGVLAPHRHDLTFTVPIGVAGEP
jgi:hypothetical protein